nr:RHS repeat-associated core domain-containing protein [Pseudomonas sp. p99-361]
MHIVPAARNYTPCGYSVLSGDLLGYNGHFQDPVSGLYPLGQGYRHFSPQLGRFYSPDDTSPFGRGGLNAYAYCQGDPVNRIDRDGHSFINAVLGAFTLKKNRTPGSAPQVNPPLTAPSQQLHTTVVNPENVITPPSKSNVTISWSGVQYNLHPGDIWGMAKEMKFSVGSGGLQVNLPMNAVLPGTPNSGITLNRSGLNIHLDHRDAIKLAFSVALNTPAAGSIPVPFDLRINNFQVGLRATSIRCSYSDLFGMTAKAAKRNR